MRKHKKVIAERHQQIEILFRQATEMPPVKIYQPELQRGKLQHVQAYRVGRLCRLVFLQGMGKLYDEPNPIEHQKVRQVKEGTLLIVKKPTQKVEPELRQYSVQD